MSKIFCGFVIGAILIFSRVNSVTGEVVKLRTAEEPDTIKKEEVKPQPRTMEGLQKEIVEEAKPEAGEVPKEERPKKSYPRISPGMLFSAPTAYVINSFAIQSVGGGSVSPEYEELKHKFFLGVIGVGLGDIAELQINWVGIFSNLAHGVTNVPATSFKLRVFPEGKKIPATALMLRASPIWITQTSKEAEGQILPEPYKFMTKSAALYLIMSKSIGKGMTLHLGGTGSDYRLKTEGGEESRNTMWGALFGFEKEMNKITILMGEYQRVPKLEFSVEGKGYIEPVDLFIFGVRFFFIRIMSLDAGITYASDYEGIADMVLHTNVTATFFLEELYGVLFKR